MERVFDGNDAMANKNRLRKNDPENFVMPKLIPLAITPILNL